MMLNAQEQEMVARPLKYRLPCSGCKHLRETTAEALKKSSMACGFDPVLPVGILIYDITETSRCITRKEIYGPFDDAARRVECPTFQRATAADS